MKGEKLRFEVDLKASVNHDDEGGKTRFDPLGSEKLKSIG